MIKFSHARCELVVKVLDCRRAVQFLFLLRHVQVDAGVGNGIQSKLLQC